MDRLPDNSAILKNFGTDNNKNTILYAKKKKNKQKKKNKLVMDFDVWYLESIKLKI